MSKSSCVHLENYKTANGFTSFSLLHTYFVTCLRAGSREKKAKNGCHECERRSGRLHACLSCVYVGCFRDGELHIIRHARHKRHVISMDLKFGNIYCHVCDDFKYDKDFESRSVNYKKQLCKLLGLKYFNLWEPTEEEMKLIKENGDMKVIKEKTEIGLRGLINLGHTCFMNCIVQVLVHTPILRDYFLSDTHHCEMEDPTYCLVCEMFVTFQEFYSGNTDPHVPSRLVYLMWTHAKHLNGFQQQDAHEFFIAILDILHKQSQGTVPDEQKCNCVIDQIFKGFYQSDIVCQKCHHISTTYDPFLDISLNLGGAEVSEIGQHNSGKVSLLDCLLRYTQSESLPIQCGNCGSEYRTKQLTLKVLPIVACFHLKRLEHSLGSKKKNTTHVRFPERFDMTPFMSSSRVIRPGKPNKKKHSIVNKSDSKSSNSSMPTSEPREVKKHLVKKKSDNNEQPSGTNENERLSTSKSDNNTKVTSTSTKVASTSTKVTSTSTKVTSTSTKVTSTSTKVSSTSTKVTSTSAKAIGPRPRKKKPPKPTSKQKDLFRNNENVFCLFAVVNHKGDRDGGHYIAYIKQCKDTWYQCDDANITKAATKDVLASEGYLLFYHRKILESGSNPCLLQEIAPEVMA